MSDLMLVTVTWRLTNMTEAQRREADEAAGRVVVRWTAQRGRRRPPLTVWKGPT
jgi:hypothetical protein